MKFKIKLTKFESHRKTYKIDRKDMLVFYRKMKNIFIIQLICKSKKLKKY